MPCLHVTLPQLSVLQLSVPAHTIIQLRAAVPYSAALYNELYHGVLPHNSQAVLQHSSEQERAESLQVSGFTYYNLISRLYLCLLGTALSVSLSLALHSLTLSLWTLVSAPLIRDISPDTALRGTCNFYIVKDSGIVKGFRNRIFRMPPSKKQREARRSLQLHTDRQCAYWWWCWLGSRSGWGRTIGGSL